MRRILTALAVALIGTVGLATPAAASDTPTTPATTVTTAQTDPRIFIESDCHPNIWYVNPDEGGADEKQGNRRPLPGEEGFTFKDNQLMHHAVAATLTLADLKTIGPGSYVADPTPNLTSFFSVEVGSPGYATLRWDTVQQKWNIGGTDIWSDDPSTFVAGNNKNLTTDSVVLSFGVGYVNTPDNGIQTIVSSVSFNGQVYNLQCKPEATATTTAPTTTTTSTVATLPVTGESSTKWIGAAGVGLIVAGAILLFLRKKRTS